MFPNRGDGARTRRVAAISFEEDHLSLAVGRAREGRLYKLDFIEETPAGGLRGGMISDVELFAGALDRLAASLERVSRGPGLDRIVCGLHGPFIQIRYYSRSFKIPLGLALTEDEINRALYDTAVEAGDGRVLLQVIPWRFVLDGYREAAWPAGLRADEMTAEALGVYADRPPFQDFQDTLEDLGLGGAELLLGSFATGRFALTPEEREAGVVLLEFAWDECRVSVYCRSKLYLYRTTDRGLRDLADRLALVMPMTPQDARRLMPNLSLREDDDDRLALAMRGFLSETVEAAEHFLSDSISVMANPPFGLSWVLSGLLPEAPGVVEWVASRVGAAARVAQSPAAFRISGHDGPRACGLVSLLQYAAGEPECCRPSPGRRAVSKLRYFPARLADRFRTALRPNARL